MTTNMIFVQKKLISNKKKRNNLKTIKTSIHRQQLSTLND